jgi:choline-phosphate cytidylyltransferase
VDEVVAEAPWVINESFLKKYEIDYVAHDEDAYASAGHDDVYGYVKSLGKRFTDSIMSAILSIHW